MSNMAVLSLMMLATPDAVTSASAPASGLYRSILSCKERLAAARPVSSRITGEDAVLCVASPDSRQLTLVEVRGGISRTPGFTVELVRRNGANSDYKVVRPEGGKVLGIKTNVTGKKVKVGTRRERVKDSRGRWVSRRVPVFTDRAKPVVYVPYSEALREPAVIRAGFDYIVSMVDKARDAVDERVVQSLLDTALPLEERRLVTEVVPEKVLITLLIIEHIDPSWIEQYGLVHSIERVLVTVGLNGEDAYDFSVSDAKASGFAQFIKSTYDRTRREYPSARLILDYVEGMKDHLNAVIAQFCLSDRTLTVLSPASLRRLKDGAHEEDLGAYIAAAYNGGEGRAGPAYDRDPVRWEFHQPKTGDELACERVCKKRCPRRGREKCEDRCEKKCVMVPRIPAQTITYVREFREVYRYLFVHGNAPRL